MLERLVAAGMDVARLNFSHGTHAEHAEAIRRDPRRARRAGDGRSRSSRTCRGPRCAWAAFAGGQAMLMAGESFTLDRRSRGRARRRAATLSHPEFLAALRPGDQVWMDDGMIQLVVEESRGGEVRCRVTAGGSVSDHKGVALPRIPVPVPCLTAKDREDLRFGIAHGVDYVAVSFVRSAADIQEVRRFLRDQGADLPIIAKLERAEIVANLPGILALVDAVMVARGDLGVEVPLEEVPVIQKDVIRQARAGQGAGDRRHPDAGVDGHAPPAHPRRGERRGHRHLRRGRRHHALGRDRHRPVPGGGGRDDGADRRASRAGGARATPRSSAAGPRPTASRRRSAEAACQAARRAARQGHRGLHPVGLQRAADLPGAAGGADHRPHPVLRGAAQARPLLGRAGRASCARWRRPTR